MFQHVGRARNGEAAYRPTSRDIKIDVGHDVDAAGAFRRWRRYGARRVRYVRHVCGLSSDPSADESVVGDRTRARSERRSELKVRLHTTPFPPYHQLAGSRPKACSILSGVVVKSKGLTVVIASPSGEQQSEFESAANRHQRFALNQLVDDSRYTCTDFSLRRPRLLTALMLVGFCVPLLS